MLYVIVSIFLCTDSDVRNYVEIHLTRMNFILSKIHGSIQKSREHALLGDYEESKVISYFY